MDPHADRRDQQRRKSRHGMRVVNRSLKTVQASLARRTHVAAIPMGKSRKVEDPYITISDGSWEWRVLKAYSADPAKPYARWFCAVKSPYTFGGWDMGDTYISEVVSGGGYIVQRDESVPDSAIPARLLKRTAKSVTSAGGMTFVEV